MKEILFITTRTDAELERLAAGSIEDRLVVHREIEQTEPQLAALLNARDITGEEDNS